VRGSTAQRKGLPWESLEPLTLVAYEGDLITRAFIEPVAVGDALSGMPLFLEPNGCVMVPLEATSQAAFAVMPRRWRDVVQLPSRGESFGSGSGGPTLR